MAQNDATIYDAAARAPLYRQGNEWMITMSGYNDEGDFVFRMIRVPLSTTTSMLGELALETLKGYRYYGAEESVRLIEAFNEAVSVEEFESDGDEAAAGVFRDGKVLRVVARWKNDEVYKAKLPLDATADAIGAAFLEGYAELDKKYPKLRDAERATALKRARRSK